MFDIYMIISFLIMAVIFLRQISIFKQPNKINYAPLILGVGAIASVLHFIISNDPDLILTLKGSFIPMLIALILYIIMNIMHQTQVAENERIRAEFTKSLIEQIDKIKEYNEKLEHRIKTYTTQEKELQEQFAKKFSVSLETLEQLLQNQHEFKIQFGEMAHWHKELTELFVNFTEFKLPELDSMVHNHINTLRISEEEHYNRLIKVFDEVLGDKERIRKELIKIENELKAIEGISDQISHTIVQKVLKDVSKISASFESELVGLQRLGEMLRTTLSEEENTILNMKQQSEYIVEEMNTIASKIKEFDEKKELIDEIARKIYPLLEKVEDIEKEYMKSINDLQAISNDMKQHEMYYLESFSSQTQNAVESIDKAAKEAFEGIKQHYLASSEEISDNVKILAKKAQFKGYQND
ncbi:MAG: hypothetical protein GXO11_05280 [Epsilonproteobacteria bacterium]|nr:hypothetical protein [Campylobacterota bacterium]